VGGIEEYVHLSTRALKTDVSARSPAQVICARGGTCAWCVSIEHEHIDRHHCLHQTCKSTHVYLHIRVQKHTYTYTGIGNCTCNEHTTPHCDGRRTGPGECLTIGRNNTHLDTYSMVCVEKCLSKDAWQASVCILTMNIQLHKSTRQPSDDVPL